MEEKHKNLIAVRQKVLLTTIVAKLSDLHPALYYSPTTEIAYEIERYINAGDGLLHDEVELLKDLSRHDIQILLSLHGG